MTTDLELLREIFKDTRVHVGVGTIVSSSVTTDKAVLKVMVNLMPENRHIIASMTFSDCNSVTFPEVNDLAVVVFADGHPDNAYVIKVCNSTEEPIPTYALTGNTMLAPRAGKKIGIGRTTAVPTEPLVLGSTLVAGLTALCNAFLNAAQIGQSPTGVVVLDPTVRVAIQNFMTTYLTEASTNVVSQVGFTERGI